MTVNKFRRGQIWWYENAQTYDGSIQGKTRPVIIISNDLANKYSNCLIGVPCTTQPKKDMTTHLGLNIDGTQSTALCESIMSLNVSRLTSYIGTCDDELMSKLDSCIRVAVGLEQPIIFKSYNPVEIIPLTNTQLDTTIDNELDAKNVIIHNTIEKPVKTESNMLQQVKTKRVRYTEADALRFLNDCDNHDINYILKKYKLKSKKDLANRKYYLKKMIIEKGNNK